MTNEEALSELKDIYEDGECEYAETPTRRETIRLAIEALEKQIPKKPHWTYPYKNNPVIREPFCGRCKEMYLIKTDKYCEWCGQAIDWSGE